MSQTHCKSLKQRPKTKRLPPWPSLHRCSAHEHPQTHQPHPPVQLSLLVVVFVVGHWLSRRRVAWLSEAGFALVLGVAVGCGVKFFTNSATFAHWISFKVRHDTCIGDKCPPSKHTYRKISSSLRCFRPSYLMLGFPSKSSRTLMTWATGFHEASHHRIVVDTGFSKTSVPYRRMRSLEPLCPHSSLDLSCTCMTFGLFADLPHLWEMV